MNAAPFFTLDTSLIVNAKQKLNRKLIKINDKISVMSCLFCRCQRFRQAPPANPSSAPLSSKLALGAGCYWGTEKYVRKNFQQKFPGSIRCCSVGFMAPLEPPPQFKNPTYQQVCSGISGHIEVLYIELKEPELHFEELIRFFFTFHDPTTTNRQGNDAGFQYSSWIFCADQAQSTIAMRVRDELQRALDDRLVTCFARRKVTTKVSPLTEFSAAHAAHQEYLTKHPNGYCNHRIRFREWPMVTPLEVKDDRNEAS